MEVEVKTNDGQMFNVTIPDYNAEGMAAKLNDRTNTMIAMGDVVVNRQTIMRISPVPATDI